VRVEPNGRHRYYRLASGELAAALEALSALSPAPEPSGGLREHSAHEALRYARGCYDHLAGVLGVQVTERLLERGALERVERGFAVTEAGAELLGAHGVDVVELARRRRAFCRACLDWTERRHHLAGSVGAALLSRFLDDGVLRRLPSSRALVVTAEGRGFFGREWGIQVLDQ
jgi:hypothetical protein